MTTIRKHHRLIPLYVLSGDFGCYVKLVASGQEAADVIASTDKSRTVDKFWLELDTENEPVTVHEEQPLIEGDEIDADYASDDA